MRNSAMVGHLAGAALAVGGLVGLAALTGQPLPHAHAVDVDEGSIEEYVTWSPVCIDGDEQLSFVVQGNNVGLVLILAETDVVLFGLLQELTFDPSVDAGDIQLQNAQVSPGFYDISDACADEPSTPDPEEPEPEKPEPEVPEPESESESDSAGTLPETGSSDSLWIALGGGLALFSGAALTAASRRRA
jgi:LPXTG-motif cell wall-anchored protein